MKKMRDSMNIKTIHLVLVVSWLITYPVFANDRELELYGECAIEENQEREKESDWLAQHGKKQATLREHGGSEHDAPGRDYYKALVEQAIERTWALPITLYTQFTGDAFDNEGQTIAHACQGSGSGPKFKDIYLFSKLCDGNKVRIQNTPAGAFNRGSTPLNVPGGQWGNFPDDQYTTLLAPTEVLFGIDQREVGAIISLIRRFDLGNSRIMQGGAGISIPLKAAIVNNDVHFVGGYLFSEGAATNQIQRENTLKEFYREFIDIFDFFETAILNPKGLTFSDRQVQVGIGDTSIFGYLEFARYFEHVSSFQLGINLIAPTGGKPKANAPLFAPTLGNGGAFQCDFFGNVQFVTPLSSFNPTIRAAVQLSGPVTSYQRIPQVKTQPQTRVRVSTVPDLFTPALFQAYYVDQYAELDTIYPAFADAATSLRTMSGPKALISVGNYFHNVFNLGFRLGILYTYMHRWQNKVLSQPENVSSAATNLFVQGTSANSQTLDWLLAYQFDNMVELNIGYRSVFAGKNVPRTRELYGSIILTF